MGCLLHMGALQSNESPTPILWHKVDGNRMVKACFSRQRFLRLSNHLRFDDKATRNERRERDNFAPFREIWDDFNINLGREYIPGPCLTVDEQLMPWTGRYFSSICRANRINTGSIFFLLMMPKTDIRSMANHILVVKGDPQQSEKNMSAGTRLFDSWNPILAAGEISQLTTSSQT